MKKTVASVSASLLFLVIPGVSFAALNTLNGLSASAQFTATTPTTTTMHMQIVTVGADTHQFQWDNTPWRLDQGGTGAISFATGSVPFISNGVFSQNNSNFSWDTINNALNIGTSSSSPLSKLTVKGSVGQALLNIISSLGVPRFFISESGNVGINTSSPQHALDVAGALYSRLVALTASSSVTVDWNQGNVQSLTLNTSTTTLMFTNGQAGGEYKLILKQDSTGGRKVAWPASVKWPGGNPPTLTSSANATDVVSFANDESNYLGSFSLNYLLQPSPLLTNLTGHWKFDESSGNAADATSNNNTLTNNNIAAFQAGKINNSTLLVASSSQYFSIADASQTGLDFTSNFSASFWVKLSSLPGSGEYRPLAKNSGTNNFSYTVMMGAGAFGNNEIYVLWSDDGSTATQSHLGEYDSPAGYFDSGDVGTWVHIAVVADVVNQTVTVYKNNVPTTLTKRSGSNASSVFDGTGTFTIGSVISDSTPIRFLDGAVDEIGVWSRKLTSTEVNTLYNNGNGLQYPF